jgi:hypothetical protein
MTARISDILPAACAALGMSPAVDSLTLPNSESVVVLLIDGMGFHNVANVSDGNVHSKLIVDHSPISTAFPTTTPVALASLGTGMQSGAHGFVGATFELAEFHQILHPLKWTDSPSPLAVSPDPTWFENAVELGISVTRIGPAAYADSGLTSSVLRGGVHLPAETMDELVDCIVTTSTKSKKQLIYGYYPKLDKIGHVHGVDSKQWRAELNVVLDAIAALHTQLPSGVTLVVTADHGMVDVENRIWIEDTPSLMRDVRIITGEPRLRHVFAHSGNANALHRQWQSLEQYAHIFTRDEFIATQLMGEVDDFVYERIGDVVAVAQGHNILASRSIDSRISNLVGHHGSDSAMERDIPLAVLAR